MKVAHANPLGHFGYWAAAIAVLVMAWTLYDATATARTASERVTHGLEALQDVSRINESVSRAESAQRGFFITLNDRYVAERDQALTSAIQNIDRLAWRLSEQPSQRANVNALKALFAERAGLMREWEGIRRTEGFDKVASRMMQGIGQKASASIYDLTEKIRLEELRLLDLRRRDQQADYASSVEVLLLGVLVLLAVLIPGYVGFIREARGRHQAERRVSDVAESLPGAVFQLRVFPDGRRRYEYLSAGTEMLRGVTREAALKDPQVLADTVIDADRKGLEEALAQSGGAAKPQPFEHDFRVMDRAGGIRWIQMSCAPRLEADGSVLWNGHWSDITEKKLMARQLHDSKEAAESASRAKTTFLASGIL